MKKLLVPLVSFLCISFYASAANVKMDDTEANCKKVDGFGQEDKMAIATRYGVPLSSVKFIGAKWQEGQYGGKTCVFIFDTAQGPKRCTPVFGLLSDDGGKTTFGSVAPMGNPVCW